MRHAGIAHTIGVGRTVRANLFSQETVNDR
jgi:hypothetical protein